LYSKVALDSCKRDILFRIYIPAKKLGVRIEDNYLFTSKGIIFLSDQIEKQVDQIEKLASTGSWQ
jgi:hypothetical protein